MSLLGFAIGRHGWPLPIDADDEADSLAFHDRPHLLERDVRVAALLARRVNPYVSFIPVVELDQVSAVELLCGAAVASVSNWRSCLVRTGDDGDGRLRGQVVVVGEKHPRLDMPPSVIGTVPGVFLQAARRRWSSPFSQDRCWPSGVWRCSSVATRILFL